MSGLNPQAFAFVPGRGLRPPQPPQSQQQPQAQPPQDQPQQFVRQEATEAPAPPPTISLNIGRPPPAPAPQPQAQAQTASLNIGNRSQPPSSAPTPPPAKVPSTASPAPAASTTAASSLSKSSVFNERSKTSADAIVREQAATVDEETLKDLYGEKEPVIDPNTKQHLNIVFIGHVDAGKSTMGGQILYLCDMVDKRTMEKYEREAKEAGRESWYLSWALDSTPQERAKGKTVEVGRAYFETAKRRYTILDAPGHKTFVPSMISGAAQADVAVLVISARKGEFETGFEKGGQTREHIMLVRTAGVAKVVVVINKMDESTVEWKKERYDEIKDKLLPFLKSAGFNPKTDITFIPVSAYTGLNMKDRVPKKVVSWWDGPSLLELLDNLPMVDRNINGPVMMPISEKYKDMGTIVVGKLESGHMRKGEPLVVMPNRSPVEVAAIYNELEEEMPAAFSGDNVRLRLRGIEDEEISPGFVLTSPAKPVKVVKQFEAQLAILDHKNIICAGYSAVMHVHTVAEEVTLAALLHYFDKKTGRKSKKPPQFAKKGQKIIALIETTAPICVERFEEHPQLGRFTLRDEGKTIAIGKVTRLIDAEDGLSENLFAMSLGALGA